MKRINCHCIPVSPSACICVICGHMPFFLDLFWRKVNEVGGERETRFGSVAA